MAPEVMTGKYGPMCDLFSVGVVFYILLTGRAPFGMVDEDDDDDIEDMTIAGDLKLGKSYFEPISRHAKSLLVGLLTTSPASRLSSPEALQHVFFNKPSSAKLSKVNVVRAIEQYAVGLVLCCVCVCGCLVLCG